MLNSTRTGDLALLYIRVGPRPTAVRVLFLKAKDSFEIETIAPGPYDLRYQDLDSGIISKSEPFPLEEKHEDIPQSDGILHRSSATNMSLTLYIVINGNTHSEVIGPEDFRQSHRVPGQLGPRSALGNRGGTLMRQP
jgi:hypothetical protein